MRLTKLLATAVSLVTLAGCSDLGKQASHDLSEQIEIARRYYSQATGLLASPQYLDLSVSPPRLAELGKKLDKNRMTVATRPVHDARILDALEKARKGLTQALAADAAASEAVKAEANLLLGSIQQATGSYLAQQAGKVQDEAGKLRQAAAQRVGMARNRQEALAYLAKLEGMQPKDVPTLRDLTVQRDRAAVQLNDVDKNISALQAQVDDLAGQNKALSAESQKLLAEATQLREQGEAKGGPEGLKLLGQAEDVRRKINENNSKVAANQLKIQQLQADLARAQIEKQSLKDKLGVLEQFFSQTASESAEAAVARQELVKQAQELLKEAADAAEKVVELNKKSKDIEAKAVAAMEDAIKRYASAEAQQRQKASAGVGATDETAVSEELQLASIVASKAATRLALAELQSRELLVEQENARLAQSMADAARQFNLQPPPAAEQLKGYLANAADVRKAADENYKAAQKELDDLLKSRLKSPVGRNVTWIYQALEARAFLGQYQLGTADKATLAKAAELVGKALANKEASPYLAAVVELSALLERVAPGVTATMPAGPSTAPGAAPAAPAAPSPAPKLAPQL